MAIIGFIFLFLIMLYGSFMVYVFGNILGLGYTVFGKYDVVIFFICLALLLFLWYELLAHSPFTVTII